MPFDSQFSLTVELTRVIPAAGLAVVGAGAALLKLARDLRASGSDILVEEDLAAIFRQHRIEPKFERQFREDITSASMFATISNVLPIVLQTGPGTTVGRALKDAAYLPFVIQTSMLCAIHDIESLSDGLEEALRLRAAASPDASWLHSESLRGTLQAVADQTTGFDWNPLFQSVQNALGIPSWIEWGGENMVPRYLRLTVPILQACLDMMAAVQRLYKDSVFKVEGFDGSVTITVWAHYVLGLTVSIITILIASDFGSRRVFNRQNRSTFSIPTKAR